MHATLTVKCTRMGDKNVKNIAKGFSHLMAFHSYMCVIVCIYVHLFTCVWTHMGVWIHVWDGCRQRVTPGIFPSCFPLYILRQGFPLEPQAHWCSQSTCQLALWFFASAFQVLDCRQTTITSWLLHRYWCSWIHDHHFSHWTVSPALIPTFIASMFWFKIWKAMHHHWMMSKQ